MSVEHELREPSANEPLDDVSDDRPVADGDEGLRELVREWTEPRSEPGREHDGTRHDLFVPSRRDPRNKLATAPLA